jgi:hypothetical protein
MGEAGFQVHPEALDGYRTAIEQQREQISAIRAKLASVALSSDAFGHLPGAQQLYQAYEEHATAEQRNFGDLLEALHGVAHGLQMSAQRSARVRGILDAERREPARSSQCSAGVGRGLAAGGVGWSCWSVGQWPSAYDREGCRGTEDTSLARRVWGLIIDNKVVALKSSQQRDCCGA